MGASHRGGVGTCDGRAQPLGGARLLCLPHAGTRAKKPPMEPSQIPRRPPRLARHQPLRPLARPPLRPLRPTHPDALPHRRAPFTRAAPKHGARQAPPRPVSAGSPRTPTPAAAEATTTPRQPCGGGPAVAAEVPPPWAVSRSGDALSTACDGRSGRRRFCSNLRASSLLTGSNDTYRSVLLSSRRQSEPCAPHTYQSICTQFVEIWLRGKVWHRWKDPVRSSARCVRPRLTRFSTCSVP